MIWQLLVIIWSIWSIWILSPIIVINQIIGDTNNNNNNNSNKNKNNNISDVMILIIGEYDYMMIGYPKN